MNRVGRTIVRGVRKVRVGVVGALRVDVAVALGADVVVRGLRLERDRLAMGGGQRGVDLRGRGGLRVRLALLVA